MSIKDLFDKNQEASQVLNSDSVKNAFKDAESEKYVKEQKKKSQGGSFVRDGNYFRCCPFNKDR